MDILKTVRKFKIEVIDKKLYECANKIFRDTLRNNIRVIANRGFKPNELFYEERKSKAINF